MSLFHNHYNRPDLYKLFTTFYVNTNANENVSLHTRNNLYLLYVDYCFPHEIWQKTSTYHQVITTTHFFT